MQHPDLRIADHGKLQTMVTMVRMIRSLIVTGKTNRFLKKNEAWKRLRDLFVGPDRSPLWDRTQYFVHCMGLEDRDYCSFSKNNEIETVKFVQRLLMDVDYWAARAYMLTL